MTLTSVVERFGVELCYMNAVTHTGKMERDVYIIG